MTTGRMNVLIGGLDRLLAAGLARELVTPCSLPPVPAPEGANHVVTATVARSAAPLPTTDYGVIVAKNLFSPDRSRSRAYLGGGRITTIRRKIPSRQPSRSAGRADARTTETLSPLSCSSSQAAGNKSVTNRIGPLA